MLIINDLFYRFYNCRVETKHGLNGRMYICLFSSYVLFYRIIRVWLYFNFKSLVQRLKYQLLILQLSLLNVLFDVHSLV